MEAVDDAAGLLCCVRIGAVTTGDVTCVVELGSSPFSVWASSITLVVDEFVGETETEEPGAGVTPVVLEGWTTPMSERDGLRMRLRAVVFFLDDGVIEEGLDALIFPVLVKLFGVGEPPSWA